MSASARSRATNRTGPSRRPGVMLTSVSRKWSLVRAFRDAARRERGGLIVAVDASPLAAAFAAADRAYVVPANDDAAFMPALLRLVRRHGVRLIIPTRDEDVAFLAERHHDFAGAGVTVMAPCRETVELCQDKRSFVDFCRRRGFGVPMVHEKPDVLEAAALPVFVRARFGKGSRHAYSVHSVAALRAALADVRDPIVQRFVQLPEYTVDLFADFSGRVVSVVPRERVVVLGGESFIGRTVRHAAIERQSVALAEALGLVGHNTIQCFADEHDVEFIEVNPRYGGGATLGFAAGAPTPRYLFRLLHGRRLPSRIGRHRDGLVSLRYIEDRFVNAGAVGRVRQAR